MSICTDIKAARHTGVVRCGFSRGGASLGELAGEFGLSTNASCYHEISADAARRLTFLVLTQDMACSAAIVAPALARSLLDRFFAAFSDADVRFFTNGTFDDTPGEKLTYTGAAWQPATAGTFDTGVLILGRAASGALWVEDED